MCKEKITLKAISTLEKCFIDEKLSSKNEIAYFTAYKNQRLSLQFAYEIPEDSPMWHYKADVKILGDLAEYATVRQVISIPSLFPAVPGNVDYDYLRSEPGLYPDMLSPLQYGGKAMVMKGQLSSLWVDVRLPDGVNAGERDFTLQLLNNGKVLAEKTVKVKVVNACLPKQKTVHTEWFYTDCIANYYHVEAFSEKHWSLIKKFMKMAVDNGINMILTPLYTPELDTYIGGERLTTQLLGVKVVGEDKYEFDFSALERWVDLCNEVGVDYLEFTHFFTQWGANNVPKIVAEVDGEMKRIFGWEDLALGDKYKAFLKALLPQLVKFIDDKGLRNRVYFHVSDEPGMESLQHYKACRELLTEFLSDFPIIDALSHIGLYKEGAVSIPVPSIDRIKDFLCEDVEHKWCYYCGDSGSKVTTGRLFAHSLTRTAILGVQMYKFKIEGFLHWGYNFYNNWNSYDEIDPCLDSTGNFFVPSGDTYLVYPGRHEEPLESLRLNALRSAMEDIRALELCEELYGREFVVGLIDETAGTDLTFFDYPKKPDFLIALRIKVAEAIENKIG